MPQYSEVSARGRDVLAALLDVADGPVEAVNAVEIRERTAGIRGEPPSDYTYEVLSDLNNDGWVVKSKNVGDDRVVQYSLTREGWKEISTRITLLTQIGGPASKSGEGSGRRARQSRST